MLPRKVIFTIAYLVFVALFVEISLQIFYYVTVGDFLFHRTALPLYKKERFAGFMNQPRLVYFHQTNEFQAHYYVNQAGFRVTKSGIEYAVAKPAGTYRIMLLGPSFAYGWGVDYDKSVAGLLPLLLSRGGFSPGNRIEFIDAGVPALPPANQLSWYEHTGKQYHPDLVIQFIYGSMAVRGAPTTSMGADDNGFLYDKAMSTDQVWREHLKRSALVFYGWTLWTEVNLRLQPHVRESGGAISGAGRELTQALRFDPKLPEVRDAIAFYEHFDTAVHSSGAKELIVYFPLSYVLYPQDEVRWRHLGLTDVSAQKAFDASFVSYLNAHHVRAINITRALQDAVKPGERLYYWLDIHWTPQGNRVAAAAIAQALTRKQP